MRYFLLLLPFFATAVSGADGNESALLASALEKAGDNREEIRKALSGVPDEQSTGMQFLVAYMPEHDLQSLTAEFLISNVKTAYQARKAVPWGVGIPDDIFFNDVLPYASINERRDHWRSDFFERFLPLVKDCSTPGEAAQVLNRDIYKILDVQYHARKRPKPDQSPYESIEAKFASCTGLSVLLIDACRALSVPARFAGTPRWANKRGNHSWVEVWDQGKWHFTGACEYNAKGLNKVWFLNDASHAIKDDRRHAIYASSWRHTGISFPMIWARDVDYVPAVNVTDRYTGKAEDVLAAGECLVGIQIWDREGGERQVCPIKVLDGDKLLHEGKTTGTADDNNHIFEVVLTQGQSYKVQYTDAAGKTQESNYETSEESHQQLNLILNQES